MFIVATTQTVEHIIEMAFKCFDLSAACEANVKANAGVCIKGQGIQSQRCIAGDYNLKCIKCCGLLKPILGVVVEVVVEIVNVIV